MKASLMASVLIGLLSVLLGCDPVEREPGPDDRATTESPASAEESPASAELECLEPSQAFTEELRTWLTGNASFDRIAAHRSGAHADAYYVAVHLEVPGADGWALFAATEIDRFAATYAVDEIANDFSDLLDGRGTRAEFSTRDPGAQEAIDCLRSGP